SSIFKAMPFQYGSVRQISSGTGPKTVIHIQDVHLNAEAQANMGKTVEALISSGQVDLIALEGAFNPIDLSRWKGFSDQEAVHRVADWMLHQQNFRSGTRGFCGRPTHSHHRWSRR